MAHGAIEIEEGDLESGSTCVLPVASPVLLSFLSLLSLLPFFPFFPC
jgi:hypothetical protein